MARKQTGKPWVFRCQGYVFMYNGTSLYCQGYVVCNYCWAYSKATIRKDARAFIRHHKDDLQAAKNLMKKRRLERVVTP